VSATDAPRFAAARIIRAAGVTFADGYPGNLLQVRDLVEQADASGEALPVILRRNPDNPYDANAVEIHVPALGAMVGHLPKNVAAKLAPALDSGLRFHTSVFAVAVDPAHLDRPGLEIRIAAEEA
jgi:hypothetical protein